jgi:lipid A 3-O-deacylase
MRIIDIMGKSIGRGLLLALSLGLGATASHAQGASPFFYEAKFGVLAHDVPNLWSGFRLERGVDINAEVILAPALPLLGGAIRPAIGGSVNTEGYTSKGYIDARWQLETASGVYFGLGLGAAVHDGHLGPDALDRKALGSRILFHIPIEIGYRFDQHNSLSVYFEHMSNGYTRAYNEALDSLGVRYGYRF